MELLILALISIGLYLTAATAQSLVLLGKVKLVQRQILPAAYFAAVLHAVLLYCWIDTGVGQNLAFFNVFSQVAWFITLFLLIGMVYKPLESLGVLVYPLAALSIVLVSVFPENKIIATAQKPAELLHILLSIAAFSFLLIAALQAILLACQEWLLRHKKAGGIVQALPPLETMESLLFQMIWLGFAFLTLAIVSSFYFFDNIFIVPLLQKTLLSLAAWFVFALLLFGRHYFGWRGQTAIRYTLSGVVLLFLLLVLLRI